MGEREALIQRREQEAASLEHFIALGRGDLFTCRSVRMFREYLDEEIRSSPRAAQGIIRKLRSEWYELQDELKHRDGLSPHDATRIPPND